MKKYGLLGRSLGHSFSPQFFESYFEEHQIDAAYELIELESLQDCRELLSEYHGFNVTIPYKEAIIPFLDELTHEAKGIGAVNVIEIQGDKWIGHNTDAFGFHQSIKPFLTNQHERALVLGTGGASKAVAYILKNLGVDVFYISRSPKQGSEFSYEDINMQMLASCKMIVNTTPLGMYPNEDELILLPYEFLSSEHLLVDVIYNPAKTRFLQEGEKQGATIVNGSTMLKEQALKAYRIWSQDV